MSNLIGEGNYRYDATIEWAKLPEGITFNETPGVAVDSEDTVFLLTRNQEHPVMVFSREGEFIQSFGAGTFSERTHGILITPDQELLCVDDGSHTITRWSRNGDLLQTIGTPFEPAPAWSGTPFNRPTHAAISPVNGDIYITDGYGNSRVHRFPPAGEHVLSWGEPGIDAGQFIRPHNIAIDEKNRIYIADRESHRVQIFDENGSFITMWNNIHRPDGLTLAPDGNIYIGELNGMGGMEGAPNLGHRVSVYNQEGERLAVFGEREEGVSAGHFIAPHGIAVDSHLDIYVGEVSFTIHGRHLDPPQEVKSFTKLIRLNS